MKAYLIDTQLVVPSSRSLAKVLKKRLYSGSISVSQTQLVFNPQEVNL